jgi:NTE family protein
MRAAAALPLATLLAGGAPPASAQEAPPPPPAGRPRTALVLAGGGARGAAHLGVLKVLEELRVPVDLIVGTSIGSIIGGLYASGLPPDAVHRLILETDWDDLFNDSPRREQVSFRRKQDDALSLMRFEMGLGPGGVELPSGLIAGQKLNHLLRELTLHATGWDDFDQFPIPYRAVAADLVDGSMVVLERGDLADAMRASMAIPGVFTPVEIDGRPLVDGGIVRNLPVDVARTLGARRIIAVDVSTPLPEISEESSMFGVVGRTYSMLITKNVAEQRALLGAGDLLIVPDLEGISSAAFARAEEAVERGVEAARQEREALGSLAVSEEEYAAFLRRQRRGPGEGLEGTRLAEVAVEGLQRVDERLVRSRIETRVGGGLDLTALGRDLERIYEIGEFEQVGFDLEGEEDARRLLIRTREKSWGPRYLRFGLSLESNFEGNGVFTALGHLTWTQLNRLGAEWKSFLAIGDVDVLSSEFYQPLDFSGFWFVAPRMTGWRDRRETFLEGGGQTVVDEQGVEGGFDVGVQFRNYGEIRVGALRGERDIEFPIDTTLSPEKVQVGAWRARLTFDQIDNAYFPRRGNLSQLETLLSRESLGADDRFDRISLSTLHAFSFGRNTLLARLRLGTDLGSEIPFYDEFELGGFLNLSGLPPGALQGDVLAYMSLAYYWQVARLPSALGGGVYAGVALEAGNAWEDVGVAELGDLRPAGLLFGGADTRIAPLYLGYGRTDEGDDSFYVFVGLPFLNRQAARP